MENEMQKKKVWAGVVNGNIEFFSSNPQGTVEGLSGSRQFTIDGNCGLSNDNGDNALLSPESYHGTDNAGSIQQSADNQTASQQTPTA